MSEENFFSMKMAKLSIDELKNYVKNKDDFQDYAVLTAILELEKRRNNIENSEQNKLEIETTKVETTEIDEPIELNTTTIKETPLLYSTQFIFIFGALFSVFGGGILMAMNLFQLKKIKAAKLALFGSLAYTVLLIMLFDVLGVTNALISLSTSLLGIFLLEQYIWKKEIPNEISYKKRDVWKPVGIGLLIAIPIAIYMVMTGNFPQP